MARRPKKGHRHESPPPEPAKSRDAKPRRGGTGQALAGRAGLVTRLKFDTSHIVPIFRTELNHYQQEAWALMGERRATLLLGPAGTAKTHCAVARAMHELINAQTVGRVVLVRPAVEAGEKLGFLPGDINQKLDPYFRPVYDIIDDLVGSRGTLREQVHGCLEVAPVGFLRGRTFKDSVVVLDEAQNCTWVQLKLVMTRLGKGSKMIITGDPDQSDLPHGGKNPLARLYDNIKRKGLESNGMLACYDFPAKAIVRDEVVIEVLNAFDDGYGEGDHDWPGDAPVRGRGARTLEPIEEAPSYGKNLTAAPKAAKKK